MKYRDGQGCQRVVTISRRGVGAWSADHAWKEAIRIKGLARDGKDPAAERDEEKAAPTLSDFASRYMEEYAAAHKKLRTLTEDRRLLRLRILPVLGDLKPRHVDRANVAHPCRDAKDAGRR